MARVAPEIQAKSTAKAGKAVALTRQSHVVGFLVQSKGRGDQHRDSHAGGEHKDHHHAFSCFS
jgi:hypothetical protein